MSSRTSTPESPPTGTAGWGRDATASGGTTLCSRMKLARSCTSTVRSRRTTKPFSTSSTHSVPRSRRSSVALSPGSASTTSAPAALVFRCRGDGRTSLRGLPPSNGPSTPCNASMVRSHHGSTQLGEHRRERRPRVRTRGHQGGGRQAEEQPPGQRLRHFNFLQDSGRIRQEKSCREMQDPRPQTPRQAAPRPCP